MAQMPKGKPRSVPDPVGDQYDRVMGLDRQRRDNAELGVGQPWPSLGEMSSGAMPSFIDESDFEAIRRAPPPIPTVWIGGRTYRQVDNGRANALVPFAPLVSPAELAERQRGIARVGFMAGSPIGSAAYDFATLANASPGARDGALVVGGLVDAAMTGAAPRGATARGQTEPPKRQADPLPAMQVDIRLRNLNAKGQAQGANATITESMLGTGSKAYWRRKPPGWKGNGDIHNEARGHLLASELGGSGEDMRNLVTLTQNKANSPYMRSFERQVASRVRGGEVVEYSATPLYCEGVLPPSSILLTAYGSRGAPMARIIQNPAGRPR